MKSIDIKSLLIGILGTALVMVLMGVTHNKNKYQVSCGSVCILLNTSTGMIKQISSILHVDRINLDNTIEVGMQADF